MFLALALRLWLATPETTIPQALANAYVASSYPDPALLLAVGYVESRFDPTAESHPHGSSPPFYCGVLQTAALSHAQCLAQRSLPAAYRLGHGELAAWRRYCHGSTTCVLNGHGCGNHGVQTGRCNGYAQRVLSLARRLR